MATLKLKIQIIIFFNVFMSLSECYDNCSGKLCPQLSVKREDENGNKQNRGEVLMREDLARGNLL